MSNNSSTTAPSGAALPRHPDQTAAGVPSLLLLPVPVGGQCEVDRVCPSHYHQEYETQVDPLPLPVVRVQSHDGDLQSISPGGAAPSHPSSSPTDPSVLVLGGGVDGGRRDGGVARGVVGSTHSDRTRETSVEAGPVGSSNSGILENTPGALELEVGCSSGIIPTMPSREAVALATFVSHYFGGHQQRQQHSGNDQTNNYRHHDQVLAVRLWHTMMSMNPNLATSPGKTTIPSAPSSAMMGLSSSSTTPMNESLLMSASTSPISSTPLRLFQSPGATKRPECKQPGKDSNCFGAPLNKLIPLSRSHPSSSRVHSVCSGLSSTSTTTSNNGANSQPVSQLVFDAMNAGISGNLRYLSQVIFAQGTPAAVFLRERRPVTLKNVNALPQPTSSHPSTPVAHILTPSIHPTGGDRTLADEASKISPCPSPTASSVAIDANDYSESIKQQFGAFLNWAVHNNQVDVVAILLANLQLDLVGDAWEKSNREALRAKVAFGRSTSSQHSSRVARLPSRRLTPTTSTCTTPTTTSLGPSSSCGASLSGASPHKSYCKAGVIRLKSNDNEGLLEAGTSREVNPRKHSPVAEVRPTFNRHLLVIAARSNLPQMTSLLLLQHSGSGGAEVGGLDIARRNSVVEAAFICATRCGFTNVVLQMLHPRNISFDTRADHVVALNARNSFGDSLLHIAIGKGHADLVSLYLRLHIRFQKLEAPGTTAPSSLLNATGQHGWTALMVAIEKKRSDFAKQLIDAGADVTVVGQDGSTALHRAAVGGLVDTVKLLLKAGADITPSAAKLQRTALHAAACTNQVAVGTVLILGVNWRLKKQLLEARDANDYTALHIAAARGSTDFFQLLLKHGADVRATVTLPVERSGLEGEDCGPQSRGTTGKVEERESNFSLAVKSNQIELVHLLFAMDDAEKHASAEQRAWTKSCRGRRMEMRTQQHSDGGHSSTPPFGFYQNYDDYENYAEEATTSTSGNTNYFPSTVITASDYTELIHHSTSKGFVELEQLLLNRQERNFVQHPGVGSGLQLPSHKRSDLEAKGSISEKKENTK